MATIRLMLDYLGWHEAAKAIEKAMEKTFADHAATIDLARFMDDAVSLSTTEFRDRLINNL